MFYYEDFVFSYILLPFYLFLRERTLAGEGQKEGDRGRKVGSMLTSQPNVGLELPNREIMTWAKFGCLTNWATQVPQDFVATSTRFPSSFP